MPCGVSPREETSHQGLDSQLLLGNIPLYTSVQVDGGHGITTNLA